MDGARAVADSRALHRRERSAVTTAIATTLTSYKNLVRAAARIDKHRKEIVPRFAKLKARTEAAVKDLDETMLRVYRTGITAEINRLTSALHDVNEGKVHLAEVNDDEDFVGGRFEAVAKLGRLVSEGSKALTEAFRQAKALENVVEKATEQAFDRPDDQFRQLAWLDRNIEESKKYIGAAIRKIEALQGPAEAAVAASDARALEQVQAAVKREVLDNLVTANDAFIDFANRFIDEVKALKAGPGVKAELIDGAQDVLHEARETSRRAAPAQEIARAIAAMTTFAVDAKKALKVLGLESKQLARLTKALAVPRGEVERALDTMIRELKVGDASGKQWLVELRKAGLLPR
jgi:hypothetical protein